MSVLPINGGGVDEYTGSILNKNITSSEIGQHLFIEFTAASDQTTITFIVNTREIGDSIFINSVEAKPLGTCNPLTIINHTEAMWQEVS